MLVVVRPRVGSHNARVNRTRLRLRPDATPVVVLKEGLPLCQQPLWGDEERGFRVQGAGRSRHGGASGASIEGTWPALGRP